MATRRKKTEKTTSSARSSKGVIPIDFSKDESEGGRKRYPEGDYAVKFKSFKTGRSREKETPYVRVSFDITEGKFKGRGITDDLYLTDASLWRIRSFLEAMGVSVPKKKVNVNFAKYIGKELGVTLSDDEYNNRVSSRVTDFLDLDTLRGADDEDEEYDEDEEDEDEEDEDDEDDDDDMEEMDVDEDL